MIAIPSDHLIRVAKKSKANNTLSFHSLNCICSWQRSIPSCGSGLHVRIFTVLLNEHTQSRIQRHHHVARIG
eukprot:scaffold22583_cov106-Cylindrotheca_fusiformis.AAC.2